MPAQPCPHRRHPHRSGFKKFVRERAKARPKQRRWAHYDDGSGNSQCPRCDKGQHRRCLRLPHCKANERSPAGINKRREGECARARGRGARGRARTRGARGRAARGRVAACLHLKCSFAIVVVCRACEEARHQGGSPACQGGLPRGHGVVDAPAAPRRRFRGRFRRRPRRRPRWLAAARMSARRRNGAPCGSVWAALAVFGVWGCASGDASGGASGGGGAMGGSGASSGGGASGAVSAGSGGRRVVVAGGGWWCVGRVI